MHILYSHKIIRVIAQKPIHTVQKIILVTAYRPIHTVIKELSESPHCHGWSRCKIYSTVHIWYVCQIYSYSILVLMYMDKNPYVVHTVIYCCLLLKLFNKLEMLANYESG